MRERLRYPWSVLQVAAALSARRARGHGSEPLIGVVAAFIAYFAFGVSLTVAVVPLLGAIAVWALVLFLGNIRKAPGILRDDRLSRAESAITTGQLLARMAQVQLPTDVKDGSLEKVWLAGSRDILGPDADLAEAFELAEQTANRGRQVEILCALAKRLREGGARYEPSPFGAQLG